MSSDEMSINKETKPRVQTLVGTSREIAGGVLRLFGIINKT